LPAQRGTTGEDLRSSAVDNEENSKVRQKDSENVVVLS
jgi:hypothetical protein